MKKEPKKEPIEVKEPKAIFKDVRLLGHEENIVQTIEGSLKKLDSIRKRVEATETEVAFVKTLITGLENGMTRYVEGRDKSERQIKDLETKVWGLRQEMDSQTKIWLEDSRNMRWIKEYDDDAHSAIRLLWWAVGLIAVIVMVQTYLIWTLLVKA